MRPFLAILALQWLLVGWVATHDPHGRTWPPWFVYETAAATSQTGPHMEVFGQLAAGASLTANAWKLPPNAACLLVIGTSRQDLSVGSGKLVPRPHAVYGRKAMGNGCAAFELPLTGPIPAAGQLYLQLVTKVGGKVTLSNAVTIDFAKASP